MIKIIQTYFLDADFFLPVMLGHHIGRINSSQLVTSLNSNRIKTSVSLTLEGVHKTVQIDSKTVPTAFFPLSCGGFNEKRFDLQFGIG